MYSATKYMNGEHIQHVKLLIYLTLYKIAELLMSCDLIVAMCISPSSGHSDVVMGLVSVNREDLHDRLKFLQNGKYSNCELK